MDKLEIKRALLYNKPSILNKTVGLVENIVFPDRIDFYPISPSPSNRHVWESLVTFDTQARRSFHLWYLRSPRPILLARTIRLVAKFEDCSLTHLLTHVKCKLKSSNQSSVPIHLYFIWEFFSFSLLWQY